MNKAIVKRIEKIEYSTLENQLVVAVIDASLCLRRINAGGKIVSEEEYVLFKKNLPLNTQLYEVEIVRNESGAASN